MLWFLCFAHAGSPVTPTTEPTPTTPHDTVPVPDSSTCCPATTRTPASLAAFLHNLLQTRAHFKQLPAHVKTWIIGAGLTCQQVLALNTCTDTSSIQLLGFTSCHQEFTACLGTLLGIPSKQGTCVEQLACFHFCSTDIFLHRCRDRAPCADSRATCTGSYAGP